MKKNALLSIRRQFWLCLYQKKTKDVICVLSFASKFGFTLDGIRELLSIEVNKQTTLD